MIIRESTRRARESRGRVAMAFYKTHKRHAGLSTHATCGATSQPCQATCDAVSSVCPAHVLTDLAVTCSTDATTCVSGQDVVVGAVTETYEGTACAGLVTDIAVPPGPAVDSTIAPLQPPSVVQALVEARVQALQAQIPTWASATCQRAARAAVCARHVALPINGLPAISGMWRRPLVFSRCTDAVDGTHAPIAVDAVDARERRHRD